MSAIMRFLLLLTFVLILAAGCSSPPPTLTPEAGGESTPPTNAPDPDELREILGDQNAEYALYSGDVLHITVQGHPELTVERKIPPSGKIPLYGLDTADENGNPKVAVIAAAGRHLPELEKDLTGLYSRIVNPPYVTLTVVEYAPKVIYVAGAVAGPKDYRLPDERRISLVQALTMAGWFTSDAAKDRVRVMRVDPKTGRRLNLPPIDVTEILSAGGGGLDILLQPGDTITVDSTESLSVFVFGHVERPGEYSWSQGLTLTRLITLAGGFKTFAKMTNIRVLRSGAKSEGDAYVVDLKAVLDGEAPDHKLEPGDRIWVDERFI
jgi:polysaccharide biosynthesis/export protein